MLSKELTTESGCELGSTEGAPVEGRVEGRGVFDDYCDFGVMITELGAVVEICGATYYGAVVCY